MATASFDIEELQKFLAKSRSPDEIAKTFEALGMPVEKMTDKEISVDITPDRIDLFTVEGAARAISYFLSLSEPKKYRIEDSKAVLNVDRVPMRPYVVAGIARGVEIDEKFIKSIIQAQEKIHDTFGRKRKKVAIGIHDFEKTKPPFAYRAFRHVTFVPLDSDKEMSPQDVLKDHPKGQEYSWVYEGVDSYPIVMDSKGVVSFPPIINAERTRVTQDTKDLFIEITGTSEPAVRSVLHIFLTALYDRGAKIENVPLLVLPEGKRDSAIFERKESLDRDFAVRTLGERFTQDEMCSLLSRLGHIAKAEPGSNTISIEVPPYRADIMHAIDFVEDIAIAHGYQNFKPSLPKFATVGRELPHVAEERKLRASMTALGFVEVATWTLMSKATQHAALDESETVEIKNPKTTETEILRPSLFPSLMSTLATNKTCGLPQRFFEIGRVANAKGICSTRAGCIMTDTVADFTGIKGIYEVANAHLHTSYKEQDFRWLIPGRSIVLFRKKDPVGWCGEISPEVIENFHLEYPAAAFEVVL